MNDSEARSLLDAEWQIALAKSDQNPDAKIDSIVNSRVQSVRYAVVTQLLGKIADPNRGVLCCQSGTGDPLSNIGGEHTPN